MNHREKKINFELLNKDLLYFLYGTHNNLILLLLTVFCLPVSEALEKYSSDKISDSITKSLNPYYDFFVQVFDINLILIFYFLISLYYLSFIKLIFSESENFNSNDSSGVLDKLIYKFNISVPLIIYVFAIIYGFIIPIDFGYGVLINILFTIIAFPISVILISIFLFGFSTILFNMIFRFTQTILKKDINRKTNSNI